MLLRSGARRKADHSPLLALPPELVSHIIRFLPWADCKNFSLICRRFCALARSPRAGLIKLHIPRFKLDAHGTVTQVPKAEELKPWGEAVGSVWVHMRGTPWTSISNSGALFALSQVLASLPNVDALHVQWNSFLDDEFWAEVFVLVVTALGNKLREVNVKFGACDSGKIVSRCIASIWEHCTRLEKVDIICKQASDLPTLQPRASIKQLAFDCQVNEILQWVIQACPNVVRVKTSSRLSLVHTMSALQAYTNLTHLSIDVYTMAVGTFREFPYFPNLEVFKITALHQPLDVSVLVSCSRLRDVSIECTGLPAGLPIFGLQRLESVEIIHRGYGMCMQMGEFSFLSAQANTLKRLRLVQAHVSLDSLAMFTALTALVLKRCICESVDIPVGEMKFSLDRHPHLRHLEIHDFYYGEVGNLAGVHASKDHTHLRSVELNGLSRLREVEFLARCLSLQRLAVIECLDLDMHTVHLPPSLTKLYFDNLGGTTLSRLANCPSLRQIVISCCFWLRSLGDGPVHVPAVTSVSIDGCRDLTNICLLAQMPALRTLKLYNLVKLRDLACLGGHPTLQQVDVFLPDVSLLPLATCPNITNGSVGFNRTVGYPPSPVAEQEERIAALERALSKKM